MKRAIILMLGLAAAHCGGALQAQQAPVYAPPPPVYAAAPAAPKIGVINMTQVYEKCEKYKKFKDAMEAEVAPFKRDKEEIDKIVEQWQKVLKNKDLKPEIREQGLKVLLEARRRLEDLDYKLKTDVNKHLEERMTDMIKYVNKTIDEFARRGGYDLVIGYGDAQLMAINQAVIDKSMARPLVFPGMPGWIDVTQDVLLWLNR